MDLTRLFDIQSAFSRRYWEGKGIDVSTREGRLAVLRENALGAHTEIDEVLRAVSGWKLHRSAAPGAGSPDALLFECVDVVKYILGILVAHDLSAEDFAEAYLLKSALVEARLSAETALSALLLSGRPLLVVRAEGLLYDPDAAADAAEGGPGRAALLPPVRLEALRRDLALSGALFSHVLPGAEDLLRTSPLPVVVLSTAPADVVTTLPRLAALVSALAGRDLPVYVGSPVDLLRHVPALVYADADPAAANLARREGVSRCYAVGGERVRRAAAPGVCAVPDAAAFLAAEAAASVTSL